MISAKRSQVTEIASNKRHRVLFLLPSLAGGGAERIVTVLLNHLDREQFDLHLGLVLADGAYRDLIPSHVSVHDLHASRARFALPRLVHLIRNVNPDTVFSTLDHLNIAVMLLRPLIPRSHSDGNSPHQHSRRIDQTISMASTAIVPIQEALSLRRQDYLPVRPHAE